ncbi:hypothetical protein [Halopseudomonas salegens]|nr:hypothetical protein [Halopseudomonas salegens]
MLLFAMLTDYVFALPALAKALAAAPTGLFSSKLHGARHELREG